MKRFWMLLLAVCVMLTGCSLAVEGSNEDGYMSQDRLAGVVVTTEYLDLFDAEGYVEDNINAIMSGKQPDQSAYQGRIWAQEVVEETTTEDGVACTTIYYNFDHVEGIQLIRYQAYTRKEDDTIHSEFLTGNCGEGMWDVTFGSELTEGTIYYPIGGGEVLVYVNPVFQDSEGRLYLVSGDGMHLADSAGCNMSMDYHEEVTETVNGEATTRSARFKVTVETTEIADHVVLAQMDGENQLISAEEYSPSALPEELVLEENCAYLIVEQHTSDGVTRQMLQPGDEELTVYVRSEKPYCLGNTTHMIWPEI